MSDAVTAGDAGWDFTCPKTDGSCGPDPFKSSGWPTAEVAAARGAHHLDEHENQTEMPSLDDFRAEHGLNPDGSLA